MCCKQNENAEHPTPTTEDSPPQQEEATAEEVSSTLDKILQNYDHRLRPNISEGPLVIQSDVFITGELIKSHESACVHARATQSSQVVFTWNMHF